MDHLKNNSLKRIIFPIRYIVVGFGQLLYGQFIKGLLFILCEVGFISFLIGSGLHFIGKLQHLGTTTQSWANDPTLGIPVLVAGDNSLTILLYGIATLILCAMFICVYVISIRSSNFIRNEYNSGRHINSFKEDLVEFLDQKFHMTILTLPILGLLVFTMLPLIFNIVIAFTNYDSDHQPPGNLFTWVGLKNFKDLIYNSKVLSGTFWPVLGWTFTWAIFATVTCFVGGLIVAMLINKKGIKLKKMWRTIFVISMAIPQFISLLIVKNMLDDYGPVNQLLMIIFHSSHYVVGFWDTALSARITVIIVNMWIGIPYTMIVVTAILMNIPQDMMEAAQIDGATNFQVFRKIKLPQILFVMSPALIVAFIGNLNNFSVIYLLTGGAPQTSDYFFAGKTDLLVTWLYNLTLNQKDYNLGAVVGIMSFLICAVVAVVAFNMTSSFKKEDQYS